MEYVQFVLVVYDIAARLSFEEKELSRLGNLRMIFGVPSEGQLYLG